MDKIVIPGLKGVQYDASFLVMVDTHAAVKTGALVFGGSAGSYKSAAVDTVSTNSLGLRGMPNLILQLLEAFMGKPIFTILRTEMQTALKGLVLMACGPAMTVPGHFECVTSLVRK